MCTEVHESNNFFNESRIMNHESGTELCVEL